MMEGEVLNDFRNDEVYNNIEQLQYDYFEHSNILCRQIISEQKALMKHLGSTWDDLDCKRREALLDLLFVDDVREQYSNSNLVTDGGRRGSLENIPESFPTLFIDSGQKIHCDFENDLWTWRDEHSGPFSWMSRSQQDLTLVDLEPENISKPQPRSTKCDTDATTNVNTAVKQFTYPVNSWSRDVIDDFHKHEKNIAITPSCSDYFSPKNINGISEDQSQIEQTRVTVFEETQRTSNTLDSASSSQEVKADVKERRKRSPSPKKIIRTSSLKRSPSKSDQGEQKLIASKCEDAYEERNTFSNPVIETEWSSFIGDETDTDTSIPPNPGLVSSKEPVIQIMDRGRDGPASSPYQGDRVQLISPTDSPSQASGISAHLGSRGWSTESTPDHSTHLLKGMQRNDKTSTLYYDLKLGNPSQTSDYEKDEVLTVENNGGDLTITSQVKTDIDSSVPTTGYDFLDNW